MPFTIRRFLEGLSEAAPQVADTMVKYQLYRNDLEQRAFNNRMESRRVGIAEEQLSAELAESASRQAYYDELSGERRKAAEQIARVREQEDKLTASLVRLQETQKAGTSQEKEKALEGYNDAYELYQTIGGQSSNVLTDRDREALVRAQTVMGMTSVYIGSDAKINQENAEAISKILDKPHMTVDEMTRTLGKLIREGSGEGATQANAASFLRYINDIAMKIGEGEETEVVRTLYASNWEGWAEGYQKSTAGAWGSLWGSNYDVGEGGLPEVLWKTMDKKIKEYKKTKPSEDPVRLAAIDMYNEDYRTKRLQALEHRKDLFGYADFRSVTVQAFTEMFGEPVENFGIKPFMPSAPRQAPATPDTTGVAAPGMNPFGGR